MTTLVAGVLIAVGIIGVVVPVLPGLLLVWAGVAVWGLARHDALGWGVLAVVTVVLAAGTVVKYLLPGRRLRRAGVPWTTMLAGTALGIVGFFALPVVGLFLGFVLGVFLAERARLPDSAAAWSSAKNALAAVGWSVLIELATGLLATGVWVAGLALA
jgi:uncharacterized protein YqgC (DUF456 family)